MIRLTDEEIRVLPGRCMLPCTEYDRQVAKAQLKKVAEHIKNLPTDGWDKWYFYNQDLARALLEEVKE